MKDPYDALGVPRTASQDDIRKAYRQLAKNHHPDLNPGNAEAAERFKEISAAYGLLSDADQRARFDRGEIDASGAERAPRGYYHDYAEGPAGAKYSDGPGFDASDLFRDLFGGAYSQDGGGLRMPGADVSYALTVDFLDAANGAKKRLDLPDGGTIDLTIPAGTEDGQRLRLRGRGQPGYGGGPPGDAYVEVRVLPHPHFKRQGADIHVDVPVTLTEAVLGGSITVPTIDGPVNMTVPKGSNTGTRLRLRGRGVAQRGEGRGDQYVTLEVMLPEHADDALVRFLEGWDAKQYSVRDRLGVSP